jgi:hypothetical protein
MLLELEFQAFFLDKWITIYKLNDEGINKNLEKLQSYSLGMYQIKLQT